MQALITDAESRPADAEQAAESATAVEAHACRVCGTALAAAQDWCLECGAASPGRFGPRPSRHPAVGVLALTLLLAGGAIAASYAAVSADSARKASAPGEQLALRQASNPAAEVAPVKTRNLTTPVAGLPARPTAPLVTRRAPAAKPKPTPTRKVAKAKPKRSRAAVAPTGPLRPLAPGAAAAATYNPYGRPDSDFGSAGAVLDGNAASAWTAVVDSEKRRSGLAVGVDLTIRSATGLRALQVRSSTPGVTLEVYGASGSLPISITDPNWTHLATVHAVAAGQRISLGDGRKQLRHLLVWVTRVPAGVDKVAINELRPLR